MPALDSGVAATDSLCRAGLFFVPVEARKGTRTCSVEEVARVRRYRPPMLVRPGGHLVDWRGEVRPLGFADVLDRLRLTTPRSLEIAERLLARVSANGRTSSRARGPVVIYSMTTSNQRMHRTAWSSCSAVTG